MGELKGFDTLRFGSECASTLATFLAVTQLERLLVMPVSLLVLRVLKYICLLILIVEHCY